MSSPVWLNDRSGRLLQTRLKRLDLEMEKGCGAVAWRWDSNPGGCKIVDRSVGQTVIFTFGTTIARSEIASGEG